MEPEVGAFLCSFSSCLDSERQSTSLGTGLGCGPQAGVQGASNQGPPVGGRLFSGSARLLSVLYCTLEPSTLLSRAWWRGKAQAWVVGWPGGRFRSELRVGQGEGSGLNGGLARGRAQAWVVGWLGAGLRPGLGFGHGEGSGLGWGMARGRAQAWVGFVQGDRNI